jgi:Transposase IS116/IS110/IS902 family
VASIADARSFDNGRQVSAWLGLVPRQHSSGGKPMLLGMSKRGDAYLRTLLIHGARSAILAAQRKTENTNVWLANLLKRRHPNIAAVALANKNVARRVGDTGPRARVPGRLCADPNGRIVGSFTDQNDRTGEHTTDCSGDHAVMAQQVGPWRLRPQQKSECTVAI